MKYNPYGEFIRLHTESEEYRKLCRCKSKKFTFYSDWEKHIKALIAPISAKNKLNDFKHYLISCERTRNSIIPLYVQFVVFFTTVYVDKEINLGLYGTLLILFISFITCIVHQGKLQNEADFYKDVIQIVEAEEKKILNPVESIC